MTNPYVVIDKRIGYTPLAELEAYRALHPDLAGAPMTYAGRLDPMASGKLLVLIGEECKKRVRYDGLDKEYVFEVALGVTTDTGDCLGLPKSSSTSVPLVRSDVERACRKLIGKHSVPYPHFSSKVVAGKALFQHALEGTIDTIEIPHTTMQVYSLSVIETKIVPLSRIAKDVVANIAQLQVETNTGTVAPDFRKDAIVEEWSRLCDSDTAVTVATCRAIVASGTYIRSLATMLGESLRLSASALSIHRSVIGRYMPLPVLGGVWVKKYV